MAEDENTRPKTLLLLSWDDSAVVRQKVATNRRSPAFILGKLSVDKDWWVRQGVARNSETPVSILKQLSKDKNEIVRKAAHRAARDRL